MSVDLEDFCTRLAPVIANIGNNSFAGQLIGFLKKQVPLDNGVILLYRMGQSPEVAFNDLPPANRTTQIDSFVNGAYLLDPYYRAAVDGVASGFYRLSELAPIGFKKSEYYRSYYRHTGMNDECGYLFQLDPGIFINISLGRTEHSQRFTRPQILRLTQIAPLIQQISAAHWRNVVETKPANNTLNVQLDAALQNFGTTLLTSREAQVVQLFLHGHSTKSIADRLGISPETVKLHRKNSYAKLDVSSQAELFYLFIDSLSSLENYVGGDPLVGYLTHIR